MYFIIEKFDKSMYLSLRPGAKPLTESAGGNQSVFPTYRKNLRPHSSVKTDGDIFSPETIKTTIYETITISFILDNVACRIHHDNERILDIRAELHRLDLSHRLGVQSQIVSLSKE